MSYLKSLGYTHTYHYPGGQVVACEVKNCTDCGKPMMVCVNHLEGWPVQEIGLKVLRTLLPEEGDKDGACENCSPLTY
jgi:hypothetical protein